jgi:hypothetical protein
MIRRAKLIGDFLGNYSYTFPNFAGFAMHNSPNALKREPSDHVTFAAMVIAWRLELVQGYFGPLPA